MIPLQRNALFRRLKEKLAAKREQEQRTEGKVAVIEGARRLYGAKVEATDLRGAAALVTAALAAEGTSEITGVHYLERGYDGLEQTLSALGADVKRI